MPTSEIIFDLADRVDPNAFGPTFTTSISAGSTTTNSYALRYISLTCSATQDMATAWQFRVPSNYSSGGTVIVSFISAGTNGNILFKTSAAVATPSATQLNTIVFNAVDTFTATAVTATTNQVQTISKALTSPGFAAGRVAWVMVGRDADDAADTCVGTADIVDVSLSYTSV